MGLTEDRNNRLLLRTLLLAAAPLYSLFGFFLLYGFQAETIDYLRYIAVSCLHLTFAVVLSLKRFHNNFLLPSILVLIMDTLVTSNTMLQPLKYCSNPAYFLSVVIIATAVIDVSFALNKKIAYVNICMVVTVFIVQAFRAESLHNIAILGPLVAFITWQIIMALKIIQVFDQVIQSKQINAYKSTVVMLNHEFNNINAICLMLLQNTKGDLDEKNKAQLTKNIQRLSDLIKKVTELQTFKEISYSDEKNSFMVKLD